MSVPSRPEENHSRPPSEALEPRALLEAIDTAAVLFDADGTLWIANRQAGLLVGWAAGDLAGRSREEWRRRLAECFPRFTEAERESAEAPAPEEYTARLEWAGYPRRVFEWASRPVYGAEGQIAGWLETLRNITELARADEERQRDAASHEREMAALEARLEQAEKFKMDLTANVTHDLRTPLASIKASVSGLLAGDVNYDPKSLRETLSVIEEETDRLQRRVQNLLSMARMEAGDAVWSRDWVDVAEVISSVLEALRSISGGRVVNVDFPDDLPLVFADYDQLQIAIRNLVENAFLYTPADQPIEVSAYTGMGQLRIRVRDRGTGLMPDEFERVFEKFYRGRSARRIPGTGLGLPICRAIAEAHGGRLWVEHAPGGGAAFVLSLPLQSEPESLEPISEGESP